MPTILAIETSTNACSTALLHQGNITERFEIAPREHANLILPMCESLLAEAAISFSQLSAIAFGRGPGSFTGVRMACAIAQAFAVAHDLPLLPVSTLRALAYAAYQKKGTTKVMAWMDARMQEMYWANYEYREHDMQLIGEEHVGLLQESEKMDIDLYPSARTIVQLAQIDFAQGKTCTLEQAMPVYIRDKVVN